MNCELTKREVEVLRLVAAGEPLKSVGKRLYLTENTVKSHVKRIQQKLGARTSTQAVAIACERGLL